MATMLRSNPPRNVQFHPQGRKNKCLFCRKYLLTYLLSSRQNDLNDIYSNSPSRANNMDGLVSVNEETQREALKDYYQK